MHGAPAISRPASGYPEALKLFEELRNRDDREVIRPEGRSILLTHGGPVERAVVLLHGLTNCPEQFRKFGELLHSHGANVVIPRCRYAGLADRMNVEQGRLKAEDLIFQAQAGADIACGLGGRVTVAGLSASAVAVAWQAHHRTDLHSVAVMDPFFGIHGIPSAIGYLAGRIMRLLPNIFLWWNPELKAAKPGPEYAYPRYSTRTIADTLRLSRIVLRESRTTPLLVKRLLLVTSEADKAVNNALTTRIAENWRQLNPGVPVTAHQFPRREHVCHDMIDPHQPGHQIGHVYPVLAKLILET